MKQVQAVLSSKRQKYAEAASSEHEDDGEVASDMPWGRKLRRRLPEIAAATLLGWLVLHVSIGPDAEPLEEPGPNGATAAAGGASLLVAPIQSAVDKRQYRVIELPNGLRTLLISDSNASKAAAALDVLAGSWDEPSSVSDLLHALWQ